MSRQRLQKVLAQAGVASRREAERLILAGRVSVNGEPVTEVGVGASLQDDLITVDGVTIGAAEPAVHYLLNKPPGVVSTVRDPQGRPTVRQLLSDVKVRLYPVGRLDADSEGLLLLTNDGDLANRLTHPRYGVEKEYVVDLQRPLAGPELDRIGRGIESEGGQLRPLRLSLQDEAGRRVVVVLTEGKKREVRRMFEAVGHRVTRLRRVRLGSLMLGDLGSGRYRRLTDDEVEQLRAATSA